MYVTIRLTSNDYHGTVQCGENGGGGEVHRVVLAYAVRISVRGRPRGGRSHYDPWVLKRGMDPMSTYGQGVVE